MTKEWGINPLCGRWKIFGKPWIVTKLVKAWALKKMNMRAQVAHSCNPSYSGGRERSQPRQIVHHKTLCWKKPITKKSWWSGSSSSSSTKKKWIVCSLIITLKNGVSLHEGDLRWKESWGNALNAQLYLDSPL
jgi:hypothetical protein